MKINFALIALGLIAANAAFASTPTYKCGTTTDIDSAKNPILLTLNADGSIGLNNNNVIRTVERSSQVVAPAGYTAYTGTQSCAQHVGGVVVCGALTLTTLYVTYPMVSGTPEGKAVLNGQNLYCSMEMMD